ncbi:MAG: LacI family DNA-binding transcriptional regulator [Armatimonadetes bacterium]|nr:LacI family DNA-binding transcriptional regulator [Armatimonadota bacterium]
MPVTIRDIAKQSNLSHTTVSRILNNRDAINIPAATRSRVRSVAEEMGYRPNANARALATGRTYLVALQLFRVDSPFCASVARTLQSLAWHDGYEVLTHEFDGRENSLRSVVDGVLVLDRLQSVPPANPTTPCVSLGSFYDETGDYVGVDLEGASREILHHFLQAGRRRIAFVARDQHEITDGRRIAYSEVLRMAGLTEEFVFLPENTRSHGRRCFAEYADKHGIPDALFCVNDEVAVGCFRALRDRGLRVPEDVALVGCDGTEEGQYHDPPLTTIAQPIEEMCRLAWEFLKQRMANPDATWQQTTLSANLRLGGSH